ncbi:hypothetical protein KUL113_19860 [Tenacibaculum sp. KUL113]|nr:hypothetical protein KUL113_19860 [Tenacibaculum sp. KUL113]
MLIFSLLLFGKVLAQEEESFEESATPEFEYNSYYMAKSNLLDVKTLDLKKNEADNFLSNPLDFPNLENLVIHFSRVSKIKDLKNTKLSSIRIMYSWQLNTLPNNFNQYSKLKKIEVYNCSLTELPSSIFNNKVISDICLCNNKISGFPKISENNSIRKLSLDLNNLKKLPSDFFNLKNLEVLTLKHCNIEEFPEVVLNLKNIKVLDLGYNPITKLPSQLAKMRQLEELYIPKTNIKKLPTSFRNSNLKYLMIDGVRLSDKEKEKLKSSLPKNCKVQWGNSANYQVELGCACLIENARF